MGNYCIECCDSLNDQLKGQSKSAQMSKKRAKFIDFNIGASTISKEEFKIASKKRREEQEKKIEQIDQMKPGDLADKIEKEINEIKKRALEKRLRQRKMKITTKPQQQQSQSRFYDVTMLDREELLQSVLGYSSLRMLNETQCEPISFFPLKNSDELLWEDQSEHLNFIILEDLFKMEDHIDYKSIFWSGYKQINQKDKMIIQITQVSDLGISKNYEKEFYYYKQLQQRLSLTKQETISSDEYDITYNLKWFLLNYQTVFIKISQKPVATLRDIIQIRRKLNQKFREQEILGLLVYLMRALMEAEAIYINHGNINDTNIFIQPDGSYKLGGFGELRIQQRKYQNEHTKVEEDESEERLDDLDEVQSFGLEEDQILEDKLELKNRFICTQSFVNYYLYKLQPHYTIYWNQTIYPIIMEAIKLQSHGQQQIIKKYHDPEHFSWTPGPEEIEISAVIMNQNFYSLAILAIQMMTLGKFEEYCVENCFTIFNEETTIENKSEFLQSFVGFPLDEKNRKSIKLQYKKFKNYKQLSNQDILQFLSKYEDQYKILYMYIIDMLQPNCDWKLIMDQLKEEDFEPPKRDIELINQYYNDPQPIKQDQEKILVKKEQSLLNQIIQKDQQEQGLLIRAFELQNQYYALRKLYYQICSYMIIRNYKVTNGAIKYLHKQLKQIGDSKNDPVKLHHYQIQNLNFIIFKQIEIYLINLFQSLSQLESKELAKSFSTLLKLERDLDQAKQDTLQYINIYNIKFYEGLVRYISGEAEEAMQFFDQVNDLCKNDLVTINEKAYYQFINIYFLLQLDQDGYYKAFRFIEELTNYHEHNCKKFNCISKELIMTYFNRGKAYYEVSQYTLSRYYFNLSQTLIKLYNGSGSDMDSLRLINLGYLSYISFLINDMDQMKEYLSKSSSIMIESLSSSQCLDTVVMWFNFFGFLLKSSYVDLEEFNAQIELFELTLDRSKLRTDKFFKKFVFGKMYYYAGNLKKAQELFLDALMLQQYYISDQLRIKQTQNISSNQQKEQQEVRVAMLKQYQQQQTKFNSTLPPPERDNLTVRILIEVYDWLGYIYIKQKDQERAKLCYQLHEELINNLFKFEVTLKDEYTLRLAKIKFYLNDYPACENILYNLSCDLKKQQVDEDLVFEYQQIQSQISRWIGVLQLLKNQDAQAHISFQRSREELRKLIKGEEELQNAYKKISTQALTKMITQDENLINSNKRISSIGISPSPRFNTQYTEGKIPTSENQSMLMTPHTQRSQNSFRLVEFMRTQLQYKKLQQSAILILLVQNYLNVIWHCSALNLKKMALNYVEECMNFFYNDPYLNSQIFCDVLQPSLKQDTYFLFGYLQGTRGQHEETNVYYKRAFQLVKEAHENNQLDHQVTYRMSVIYDQMQRVLCNQGFYLQARQYLLSSLSLLQQLKRQIDRKQLGYKNANLGALNLRLTKYKEAQFHLDKAVKIFEEEYGKISIPVLTVKSKLLEVLLQSNTKAFDINKLLYSLIKSYQLLTEKQFSLRLDGLIDRMAAQFRHRIGNYKDASTLYMQSFVKLLDDNEFGMLLLSRIEQGEEGLSNILTLKSGDKASLEVALKIAQLYIDNYQYFEAFQLLNELLILSQGTEYEPPMINEIIIFGMEEEAEIHKSTEGVIKTLSCLNKQVSKECTQTVYEQRKIRIYKNLKYRRHVNLLYQADVYRLISYVLNYWYSLKLEPYLYLDYGKLYQNHLYMYNLSQEWRQEIEKQQNNCISYLLDALIIYQETIGDSHEHFIEALFLLIQRQYLQKEFDEVDMFIPQILGMLKNQNFIFPMRFWRCQLIQAKTRLNQNVVGGKLIKCLQTFNLDLNEDYLRNTAKLLKLEDYELNSILGIANEKNRAKIGQKFIQIMEDPQRKLRKADEMLPGQLRIAMEAEKIVQRTKGMIEKFEQKYDYIFNEKEREMKNNNEQVEGNHEIIRFETARIKHEIDKLQQYLDCLIQNQ